ncbi:hypothetical protein WKH56_09525 [Priestia sp. SB1]|uniref:Uncharacterized protein n=1 Tax=Priestia aryabhattai TaxID=412384 RepID=A0AAX6NE95_PRIAR|nr:hypothetical protein [Priestia aryabhattai]MDU9693814.1 hypothetical protein [Priestia aryabhattai]NGY88904.1 hypothetical protein [Priestia megaterium]
MVSRNDIVLYNQKEFVVLWVYSNGNLEIRDTQNNRDIVVVDINDVHANTTKGPSY